MTVPAASPIEKRSQDFTVLQSSLQSGNIVSAQGAFAAFLQDVQNVSTVAGPKSLFAPGTTASKDLSNLGNALKSSNISAARTAFAQLQQDLRASAPSHSVVVTKGHRPLSQVDIANNSSVPLQTVSPASMAKAVGGVLDSKA